MLNKRKQGGFTLIELLIVIVIIGILAGVLIAVIDPTSQQNRAKDAGIQAAINKAVLATEGYLSAYGIVPTDVQFLGQFGSTVTDTLGTCAAGNYVCEYAVTGNPLGNICTNNYSGSSGLNQCYFRYDGDSVNNTFTISAKSAGIVDVVFVYHNSGVNAGVIQHCSVAATPVCP